MARLPIPGSDANVWGNVLNEYLSVEHNIDGSLKKAGDIANAQNTAAQAQQVADQAAADAQQAQAAASQAANDAQQAQATANNVSTGLGNAQNAITQLQTDVQVVESSLATKLDAAQVGVAGGVATLDGNGRLVQPIDAANINAGVLDAALIPDLSAVYLPVNQAILMETYDGNPVHMKLLSMPDSSIRAVPANATAPAAPTNLALDTRLVFLTLTWDAVDTAAQYRVYRNGVYITTTSALSYFDESLTVGETYNYTVIAVNEHGMWSAPSLAAAAFIDPALNTTPSIAAITVWPSNPRPNEKVYVRVNALDVDAQALAMTLGVSVGSLQATFDPSTWIWQGV